MSISPLKTLDRIRKGDIEYLIVELGVENGVPIAGCIPLTNQVVYFPAEDITLSNDDEAARRSLPHYMRSKIAKELPATLLVEEKPFDEFFDEIEKVSAVEASSDEKPLSEVVVEEKRKRSDKQPTLLDMADGLVYVIEQLETDGVLDVPLLESIYHDLKDYLADYPNHPEKVLLFGAETQIYAVMGIALADEDGEEPSETKPYKVKDESFISSLIEDIGKTQKTLSEIE